MCGSDRVCCLRLVRDYRLIIARSLPSGGPYGVRWYWAIRAMFEVSMKMWRGLLGAGALLVGNMAFAQVQDMPGGPRVNQLNLHEGVTQIARDAMWLHWMMLTICVVISLVCSV